MFEVRKFGNPQGRPIPTYFTSENELENTKIKFFIHFIIKCKKKKTSDLYSTFFLNWVEKITLLPEFVIVT